MIIRRVDADLLLINQDDHAALAGRIMTAWRAGGLSDRSTRARVLEATSRHDLGWQVVDAEPSVDPETGIPYEFVTAPLEIRQEVWPRAIAQLAPRDPYVAALVAHHAVTVYRRYLRTPGWETFFPDMERRRDDLLGTDALRLDTFLEDYAFVGMGDLWSLVFCTGWQDPHSMERYRATLRARTGPPVAPPAGVPNARGPARWGGEAGQDQPCQADPGMVDGGWLEIVPDPFQGATVSLDVPARRISARRYTSDIDLRDAVARAPIVQLTGLAAGPTS